MFKSLIRTFAIVAAFIAGYMMPGLHVYSWTFKWMLIVMLSIASTVQKTWYVEAPGNMVRMQSCSRRRMGEYTSLIYSTAISGVCTWQMASRRR